MKTISGLLIAFVLFGLFSCQSKDPDRIVTFDDYQIHINDTGRGEPTVIIEAALGSGLEPYDTLQTAISTYTRVLSYDRPGLGGSTRSPNPRILPVYADELKLLLEKENIRPPYILVGHSMGGLLVRFYAHRYPEEVVGLVLVDCLHEDWFEHFRTHHTREEVEQFDGTIDMYRDQSTGVAKEEWEQFEYNAESMRGIEIPAHIPVRVISATRYTDDHRRLGYHPEDMEAWAKIQAGVMKDVKNAKQIITDKSGHAVQNDEPGLIIDAIKELIDMYRNKPK